MQKRTLENLILEDEDYIFGGDLTINGDINIKNGNLIVSGTIAFVGDDVSIVGGDIVCESLVSRTDILIRDGDIFVKSLYAQDIDSDGNIEVNGDSNVADIKALNYLVSGNNDSEDINVIQNVYVLGNNHSDCIVAKRDILISGENVSYGISAHDILIEGNCNLCDCNINAKTFICKGTVSSCCSVVIA